MSSELEQKIEEILGADNSEFAQKAKANWGVNNEFFGLQFFNWLSIKLMCASAGVSNSLIEEVREIIEDYII